MPPISVSGTSPRRHQYVCPQLGEEENQEANGTERIDADLSIMQIQNP